MNRTDSAKAYREQIKQRVEMAACQTKAEQDAKARQAAAAKQAAAAAKQGGLRQQLEQDARNTEEEEQQQQERLQSFRHSQADGGAYYEAEWGYEGDAAERRTASAGRSLFFDFI
jgi:hypothetical protein